ncbi:MAG TPA: hypothetical protein VNS79_05910 [Sphingobium sp.]|nr:hypothetical protein [Sphingobium sp.]
MIALFCSLRGEHADDEGMDIRLGAGRAGIQHIGHDAQRVDNIGTLQPGDRITLRREQHAPPPFGIVCDDGGGSIGRIGQGEHQAGGAKDGGEMIEIRAAREGDHDGAGGIIDAGTDGQLAIGGNLEQLDSGVGFHRRIEVRRPGESIRQYIAIDCLIIEQHHRAARQLRELRKINRDEGVGHAGQVWRAWREG